MNELQKVNEVSAGLATATGFELAQRVGLMLSRSTMVPKEYQGEQGISNCIIALDMARRLNANELMVMQNLHIIHGRPGWSSKFLIATINSCGKYEPLRFRTEKRENLKGLKYFIYKYVNGKNTAIEQTINHNVINIVCTAYTTLKGSSEELESTEISIEMAIKEGWYSKTGSKWLTMPEQMLRYRAASFWVSVYAPEISMGMSTSEELIDIEELTEVNNVYTPKAEIKKEAEIKNINTEEVEQVVIKEKKKRFCDVCKTTEMTEEEARESLDKSDKLICFSCSVDHEQIVKAIMTEFGIESNFADCLKFLFENKIPEHNNISFFEYGKNTGSWKQLIQKYIESVLVEKAPDIAAAFHKKSLFKDFADGLKMV